MAAVAGVRGTGDWGTDERPKSFRENILWMNPNGTAPIFALTGKAGKKTVTDPEFSWWNETQNLVQLVVSGAYVAGDTTITVAGTEPDADNLDRLYGSATHLKGGDLLLVKPAADSATYNAEVIQVQSVLSTTQFIATRGVGGTTPASISNGQYLLLIGSAYAEGTGAPPAVSRNPVKYFNYTQIFKDTYELTGTADQTEARTGNPWSNDKKRKGFDHARDIELAILFGSRSEATGPNGKPMRTMGGLRDLLPPSRQYVYSTATSINDFLDRISPAFDFESEAGSSRIVMAGNAAIMELSKVVAASSRVTMELGEVVKLYGLDLRRLVLPRGELMLHSHPLLSQDPMYRKSMFVLDFSSLKYVALRGRDTKAFDDVQAKDEDVRRGFYQTECSLMLDRGGLTMMYIGNISAT